MVIEERDEGIAILGDGSGGYLIVEILAKADTYQEAKEIFADIVDEQDDEDEEDEEDE